MRKQKAAAAAKRRTIDDVVVDFDFDRGVVTVLCGDQQVARITVVQGQPVVQVSR